MMYNLDYQKLRPTRDYLHDISLVLGKFQQVFLTPDAHDWFRGLEVTENGLSTQALPVKGQELRVVLNFRDSKISIGEASWPLGGITAPELFDAFARWLHEQGIDTELVVPEFTNADTICDAEQSNALADALWWIKSQLTNLSGAIQAQEVAPILLFPHHFDLSEVWHLDASGSQLSLGFSTGDSSIAEPYLYITAYPEPAGAADVALPSPVYWQTEGFSGAILLYKDLAASSDPEQTLKGFAETVLRAELKLF
jgi:hypothetical protein